MFSVGFFTRWTCEKFKEFRIHCVWHAMLIYSFWSWKSFNVYKMERFIYINFCRFPTWDLLFILLGTEASWLKFKRQRNNPPTISASNPGSEIFLFFLPCHDRNLFPLLFPCCISQADSRINLADGWMTLEFGLKVNLCHSASLDSRFNFPKSLLSELPVRPAGDSHSSFEWEFFSVVTWKKCLWVTDPPSTRGLCASDGSLAIQSDC